MDPLPGAQFTSMWMQNPWGMTEPSQLSNAFSNYNNAPFPWPPTYAEGLAGGPVDAATGLPLQSYQNWRQQNPAGVTLNATPAQSAAQARPVNAPNYSQNQTANALLANQVAGPTGTPGPAYTGVGGANVTNMLMNAPTGPGFTLLNGQVIPGSQDPGNVPAAAAAVLGGNMGPWQQVIAQQRQQANEAAAQAAGGAAGGLTPWQQYQQSVMNNTPYTGPSVAGSSLMSQLQHGGTPSGSQWAAGLQQMGSGGGQAQPSGQPSGQPNNWQAAIQALARPPTPQIGGATVPLSQTYQPAGGVNEAFLQQAAGRPNLNQGFMSALAAIQGRPPQKAF